MSVWEALVIPLILGAYAVLCVWLLIPSDRPEAGARRDR